MRAMGVNPCFSTAAAEASSRAAAPSLTPLALPAVTVPPSRTKGLSLASASAVVSARGCSSTSKVTVSLRPFTVTGVICAASTPSCCARAARCWERRAKASWSARLT
jgi:hypothetical protein